jgi:beta-glucosidase
MSGHFPRGQDGVARPVAARLALVVATLVVAACGSSTSTSLPGASTPGASAIAPATGSASTRPWLDTGKPIDERVAALLAQMSPIEKIGQMAQIDIQGIDAKGVQTALLGSVLSGGDSNPQGENNAQNWYDMVNSLQQGALSTRLGIPILYGVDAVHGDGHLKGTTVFPHNIGMGATHDAALIQQACRMTAVETSATGVRWAFAPMLTVPQDVRWGRTYEGYGENTDLVSQLGSACIKGLQGTKLSDQDAVDPKSYLGDGGTAYGSSTTQNQGVSYLLDQGVDQLDDATIEKLFLPPYKSAVDSGARIVMASFSSTQEDGKIHGDKHWLTDVLRTQLGFTGFVVSDWGGIDQIDPNDYRASLKQAINAGIDMAMVPYDWQRFESTLKALVDSGDVPQSRIDDAVTRILRVKFEMGLFENPMPPADRWGSIGSDANRAVAAKAVSESAVLLKMSPGLLPIAATGRVLLAGAGADDLGITSGGWTLSWQGQAGNVTAGRTLKTALQAKLGDRLDFDAGGNFAAGTHASVGVVVVAERPMPRELATLRPSTCRPPTWRSWTRCDRSSTSSSWSWSPGARSSSTASPPRPTRSWLPGCQARRTKAWRTCCWAPRPSPAPRPTHGRRPRPMPHALASRPARAPSTRTATASTPPADSWAPRPAERLALGRWPARRPGRRPAPWP